MRVVRRAAELTAALAEARLGGPAVGLVPTMGALHAGHGTLVRRAAAECDTVVVTVFVNPLQFDDPADLAAYPRALDDDLALAGAAGADVVFAPPVEELYRDHPRPPATTVHVDGLGERWEGSARPGHFDGVATVVAKLFALAGPCRAYFGEKDFQQLAVVRRLVADLSFPVEVVGCPTVREPDGLALSSRNRRLGPAERAAATVLHRALEAGRAAAAPGATPADVDAAMAAVLAAEPGCRPDYAAVVDAASLEPATSLAGQLRLLVAARIGPVRLIDNAPLAVPSAPAVPARGAAPCAAA